MTLKEYIKNLKTFEKQYGHLPVIQSSDDEGNSYQPVYFTPSIGEFNAEDREFDSEVKPEKVNAVCIN